MVYLKKQIYEAEMGSTASALDDASETSAADLHSVEDLFKLATPDYRSNDDCILSPDRLPRPLDDLLCCICKHIVNRGVEAKCCHHHFCAECIWEWLHACAKRLVCGHPLLASALAPLHPGLSGILAQVHVSCDFAKIDRISCRASIPLQNLREHVANGSFRPGGTPHSPLR